MLIFFVAVASLVRTAEFTIKLFVLCIVSQMWGMR